MKSVFNLCVKLKTMKRETLLEILSLILAFLLGLTIALLIFCNKPVSVSKLPELSKELTDTTKLHDFNQKEAELKKEVSGPKFTNEITQVKKDTVRESVIRTWVYWSEK